MVTTDLNADEGDIFSILGDDERASRVLVIQHSSGFEDLQILVAHILDGGDDPDFGHGRDLVGGSREKNLKLSGGANGGLGVGTDGHKTESKERQGVHDDAKESKGSCGWAEARRLSAPDAPSSLYLSERERFGRRNNRGGTPKPGAV